MKTTISVDQTGDRAVFTPPNGITIPGHGAAYYEYEEIQYMVFAFGTGSGSSHVTIYPDKSAIWTGHYRLQENVASSSFGSCEVAN